MNGVVVAFGKVLTERPCQVMSSLKNAERLQTTARRTLEGFFVESRIDETDIVRQTVDGLPIEQVG